jgi:hypothetical protein
VTSQIFPPDFSGLNQRRKKNNENNFDKRDAVGIRHFSRRFYA